MAMSQPNGATAAGKETATSTAMTIGTDVFRSALEPTTAMEAVKFAELMASGGQWGSLPEIMGKIALGRTIGLPWMIAVQKVYLIKGSFSVAADTLMALCLRATNVCEYFEPEECDAEKATFVTKRVGRPEKRWTYTIEDAEALGVVDRGKDEKAKSENNWSKSRKQMLQARCKALLARLIYPDITQGLLSTEELTGHGAIDPNEMVGEVIAPGTTPVTGPVISIQTTKRDFAKEAMDLKTKIDAAISRAQIAEVRDEVTKWNEDAPDTFRKDVAAHYEKNRQARVAAKAGTAPTEPTSLGDQNLFTPNKASSVDTKDAK